MSIQHYNNQCNLFITITCVSISTVYSVSCITQAGIATNGIVTIMFTSSIVNQTLVNIYKNQLY